MGNLKVNRFRLRFIYAFIIMQWPVLAVRTAKPEYNLVINTNECS